jgi:hypothetical protein
MKCGDTHHIVMADEVLEGESSRKPGLEGLGSSADDAEQGEGIVGLLGLLLEGVLGCREHLLVSNRCGH